MKTETIRRPANISKEAALAGLKASGKEVVSLEEVGDDITGREYVATVKVAEFPPAKDDGGDEGGGNPFGGSDEGGDDKPKDDEPSEDKTDDEGSDKPKEDGEGDDKPKEPKMSEVMDLMTAIAEKLGVPLPGDEGLGEDPLAPEGEPMGLPDVGAPPAGDIVPPADHPLPPPVPEKPHGMGGGGMGPSFSHIVIDGQEKLAGRRSAVVRVVEAHVMNDGEIVNEARVAFPDWKVKKIDRKTLAGEHIARVLIQKD